jgi:hypothetical protein
MVDGPQESADDRGICSYSRPRESCHAEALVHNMAPGWHQGGISIETASHWYRGRGSNPHEGNPSADFKSAASTNSATPALPHSLQAHHKAHQKRPLSPVGEGAVTNWRRRPESNRGYGLCRPLPYHLATPPIWARRESNRHPRCCQRRYLRTFSDRIRRPEGTPSRGFSDLLYSSLSGA